MEKEENISNNSSLKTHELRINNVVLQSGKRKVTLSGTIDEKDPGEYLLPFLDNIHNTIIKREIPSIEIDIRDLIYINSAGIKDLINWLLTFKSHNNNHKYTITFLCNKDSRWQGLSISMIQKIIPKNLYRKFV